MLIKITELSPEPEATSFGRKWRREEIWSCQHGEYTFINESGWMCRGQYDPCKCCGIRYCYVDMFHSPEPEYTNELCHFCVSDVSEAYKRKYKERRKSEHSRLKSIDLSLYQTKKD